jgi:hypothetical protein
MFSADGSPSFELSAIVSQLFPIRNHLSIRDRENFVATMETNDDRPDMKSPDTSKLAWVLSYVIAGHVNLFPDQPP